MHDGNVKTGVGTRHRGVNKTNDEKNESSERRKESTDCHRSNNEKCSKHNKEQFLSFGFRAFKYFVYAWQAIFTISLILLVLGLVFTFISSQLTQHIDARRKMIRRRKHLERQARLSAGDVHALNNIDGLKSPKDPFLELASEKMRLRASALRHQRQ